MALANGSRFGANSCNRLGGGAFRGSAAFFALLLAGASGAAADPTDAKTPDHATASGRLPDHAVTPPAVNVTPAEAADPGASKFSRRRLPLSRPFHGRSMLA